MNKDFKNQLIQELRNEGADLDEQKDLLQIVSLIGKTSKISRSESFKRSFLDKLSKDKEKRIFFSPRAYIPVFLFILLLFVLVTSVVSAQKSLPGQALYPIKILSEKIIKRFNPSFNSEILRRRSEEIKSLIEQKKDSGFLDKTLDNYNRELEVKGNGVSNIKIEESKKNLEKAKEASEEKDKKKIEEAIKKTENELLKINNEDKKVQESKENEVKSAQSSNEEKKDEKKEKDGNGNKHKKED